MPDFTHEEFLTVAEVAATLKLNQQTIRNWVDDGKLPALRIGRRVRILRSDFQRLLDESASSRQATPSPSQGRNHTAQAFWDGSPGFDPVQLPPRAG